MDFNNDGLAVTFREFLGYFVKQFFPLVNTQIEKLYFARFDYPLLVFPVYILAIIGLFKFWRQPKRITAIFAGLGAGLLFYFYFHYWVYWTIVIFLLFVYVFLFERKNELFKNFLVLMAVLAVLAAPYFVNYFSFRNLESAHDYSLRLGVAEGRQPGLTTIGLAYLFYAGLSSIIYFLYWPSDKRKAVLLWSFLLAAVVVWNIQLVVGFAPAPNNWRRTISPLLYISIFLIVYDFIRRMEYKMPSLKKIVAGAVVFLTFMVVAKKVVNVFEIWRNPEQRILDSYAFSKNIKDSWDWININLNGEPRILSDSFVTSIYLNTYTSARPFLPIGNATSQATEKLEERYLLANKLLNVPPETIRDQLNRTTNLDCSDNGCFPNTEENLLKNPWHLYFHFFRQGPFHNYMAYPKTISSEYIGSILERYASVKGEWRSTEADYVYFGPWEKQFSNTDLSKEKSLRLIYRNPEVEIYKILKT